MRVMAAQVISEFGTLITWAAITLMTRRLARTAGQPTKVDTTLPAGVGEVEYNSNIRHYVHQDSSAADITKRLTTGVSADASLMVVSAADGPMPPTREHLKLLREAGAPRVVVFLNKTDSVDDEELAGQVATECRDLLAQNGFPGDVPIVRGSARIALEQRDDGEQGTTAVKNLVHALDSYIPDPAGS